MWFEDNEKVSHLPPLDEGSKGWFSPAGSAIVSVEKNSCYVGGYGL
jgi:hypothetical protein